MDLDLIGYLLGLLDSDENHRVESALLDDPVARRRLDRLRATFAPLDGLRFDEQLPPGLAERTVAYVMAQTMNSPTDRRPTLARRYMASSDRPDFRSSRWRSADVLVAACIMVILGGLGIAGVNRLQQRREIATCQNNMRQMHFALANYSDRNQGQYPKVEEEPPYNVAGAYIPILQQAGTLPSARALVCPSVAKSQTGAESDAGYAYSLGYRDGQGHLYGLRREDSPAGNDLLPILSDLPRPANHRNGYNVLFIGGNVRFLHFSQRRRGRR